MMNTNTRQDSPENASTIPLIENTNTASRQDSPASIDLNTFTRTCNINQFRMNNQPMTLSTLLKTCRELIDAHKGTDCAETQANIMLIPKHIYHFILANPDKLQNMTPQVALEILYTITALPSQQLLAQTNFILTTIKTMLENAQTPLSDELETFNYKLTDLSEATSPEVLAERINEIFPGNHTIHIELIKHIGISYASILCEAIASWLNEENNPNESPLAILTLIEQQLHQYTFEEILEKIDSIKQLPIIQHYQRGQQPSIAALNALYQSQQQDKTIQNINELLGIIQPILAKIITTCTSKLNLMKNELATEWLRFFEEKTPLISSETTNPADLAILLLGAQCLNTVTNKLYTTLNTITETEPLGKKITATFNLKSQPHILIAHILQLISIIFKTIPNFFHIESETILIIKANNLQSKLGNIKINHIDLFNDISWKEALALSHIATNFDLAKICGDLAASRLEQHFSIQHIAQKRHCEIKIEHPILLAVIIINNIIRNMHVHAEKNMAIQKIAATAFARTVHTILIKSNHNTKQEPQNKTQNTYIHEHTLVTTVAQTLITHPGLILIFLSSLQCCLAILACISSIHRPKKATSMLITGTKSLFETTKLCIFKSIHYLTIGKALSQYGHQKLGTRNFLGLAAALACLTILLLKVTLFAGKFMFAMQIPFYAAIAVISYVAVNRFQPQLIQGFINKKIQHLSSKQGKKSNELKPEKIISQLITSGEFSVIENEHYTVNVRPL